MLCPTAHKYQFIDGKTQKFTAVTISIAFFAKNLIIVAFYLSLVFRSLLFLFLFLYNFFFVWLFFSYFSFSFSPSSWSVLPVSTSDSFRFNRSLIVRLFKSKIPIFDSIEEAQQKGRQQKVEKI